MNYILIHSELFVAKYEINICAKITLIPASYFKCASHLPYRRICGRNVFFKTAMSVTYAWLNSIIKHVSSGYNIIS